MRDSSHKSHAMLAVRKSCFWLGNFTKVLTRAETELETGYFYFYLFSLYPDWMLKKHRFEAPCLTPDFTQSCQTCQQMCYSKDAETRSDQQRRGANWCWTSLKNRPNRTQGLRSSLTNGQLWLSVHTQTCQRANLHNQTHNLKHQRCPNTRKNGSDYCGL